MEPGTALAVVALVIDLSKDLYEFYRAYKDCPSDIAELRRQLLAQRGLFLVLQHMLERHSIDADKLQLLENAVLRCNEPAKELRAILDKFPQPGEAASMREKMRFQARRLFYPFRQGTIGELKDNIETCRSELQGAVGVVNLDATLGLSQQLTELDQKLVNGSEKLDDVAKSLRELFARMMQDLSAGAARTQASLDDEKKEKRWNAIMAWLCTTDYSSYHNGRVKIRAPDTGKWIFESPEFIQWSQGFEKALVCYGDAGVGKTIIAATVIEHLLKSNDLSAAATTYMYFHYKHESEQDVLHVLCALLRQLVWTKQMVPETLGKLYDKHYGPRSRPDLQEIQTELTAIISAFATVNIIIDALDECRESFRKDVVNALKRVQGLGNARVLITSRLAIKSQISEHLEDGLSMQISASDSDLTSYLNAQLLPLSEDLKLQQDLKERIVTTIVAKVKGM